MGKQLLKISKLPDVVCAMLGIGMALLLTATALGRYFNWFHIMWANEVSQWMFLWLSLLGAAIAVRDREHFRMTSLLDRVPPRFRRAFELANDLLAIAVGGFVLIVGVLIYRQSAGSVSGVLRVPAQYINLAFAVSGVLMLIYGAQEVRNKRVGVKDWKHDDTD